MNIKTLSFFIGGFMFLLLSCDNNKTEHKAAELTTADMVAAKKQIATMLDAFNVAAAQSDFTQYFNYFAEDAIFIGTDATENWNKKDFMVWAKPFFDKKRTWNFTSIERHIYFGKNPDIAWFDELLDTQMKICRGSGVVVKQNNAWKVQQYVLSTTIPNSQIDSIVKMKTPIEDAIIKKMLKK